MNDAWYLRRQSLNVVDDGLLRDGRRLLNHRLGVSLNWDSFADGAVGLVRDLAGLSVDARDVDG